MNTIFDHALWVSPLFWTLMLLGAAIILFVHNKIRMDVVALLVMLSFYLSGILSIQEILVGFSDPNIILIALLFIVGESLVRTGIAYRVSDGILKVAGNSEAKVLILLKRLMMPLSVAGLISGMMTLIATAPNLVVNAELVKDTNLRLEFFDFTPIGLLILALGMGYMLIVRRWLSDNNDESNQDTMQSSMNELINEYGLKDRTKRLVVKSTSPFVGKTLDQLHLRSSYQLNVLAIERWKHFRPSYIMPLGTSEIKAKDILMVDLERCDFNFDMFCQEFHLEPAEIKSQSFDQQARSIGMAELIIVPNSACIGKTTAELQFRTKYGLNVVGIKRDGVVLSDAFKEKYRSGDLLLVIGDWRLIQAMRDRRKDFLVLNYPKEMERAVPAQRQAPLALLSILTMVVLMVSGVVPNVVAALIGCLMLAYFRCVDAKSAYDSIQWPSLILIIGMMPFSTALQKTGGVESAVKWLTQIIDGWGMYPVLIVLFVFCALVGLFISNTATAILMAPIAISLAQQLNVSPVPFAMVVAIAASAAFMTPVSSPVNTMVVGPGGYKFADFIKIGVPFTLIVMLVTVFIVPILFPF